MKLENFKLKCWDFYLLSPVWLLENDFFDEVVIWRLQPKQHQEDIIFNLPNNKKYIQKWVKNFQEVFSYSKPDISFFRGGFPEYDHITKQNPEFFGTKLYLGAGRRITSQYGGVYDFILIEDERDSNNNHNCLPFFKTANPKIFRNLDLEKKYDICWPCNFSQIRYKGQEFFISSISKSSFLKSLKIIHMGNKPEEGKKLCKRYNVKNIDFIGWVDRYELNRILNQSKFGIVTSNNVDGCPRISSEILMSGTPLLIREQTRLLNYYEKGVIRFEDNNITERIEGAFKKYYNLRESLLRNIKTKFSVDIVSLKNFNLWTKK